MIMSRCAICWRWVACDYDKARGFGEGRVSHETQGWPVKVINRPLRSGEQAEKMVRMMTKWVHALIEEYQSLRSRITSWDVMIVLVDDVNNESWWWENFTIRHKIQGSRPWYRGRGPLQQKAASCVPNLMIAKTQRFYWCQIECTR